MMTQTEFTILLKQDDTTNKLIFQIFSLYHGNKEQYEPV